MKTISQGFFRHIEVARAALQTWFDMNRKEDRTIATQLLKQLGNLKGPMVKMAQITAMIPGLIPAEYAEILQELCTHSPPMEWSFVRRILIQELGPSWQDLLPGFDPRASFAASLGQVHRARLPDGTSLACKIQYPGMEKIIATDCQHLAWACSLYEKRHKAFDTQALQAELRERLLEEIDYEKENQHLQWFGHLLQGEADIRTPRGIPSLSTKKVLTTTWMEGRTLQEAFSESQSMRDRLGQQIFRAWYIPFYTAGLLHGDPHIGNILWTKEELTLLDFGCVRAFSPSFVEAFLELWEGIRDHCKDKQVNAYKKWGFLSLSPELVEALTSWASFFLAPFFQDRVCALEDFSPPSEGKRIAQKVHQLLIEQGGLNPPREFLIFDRVAVVVGSVLVRLGARANWYRLFLDLTQIFSLQTCLQTQQTLFSCYSIPITRDG